MKDSCRRNLPLVARPGGRPPRYLLDHSDRVDQMRTAGAANWSAAASARGQLGLRTQAVVACFGLDFEELSSAPAAHTTEAIHQLAHSLRGSTNAARFAIMARRQISVTGTGAPMRHFAAIIASLVLCACQTVPPAATSATAPATTATVPVGSATGAARAAAAPASRSLVLLAPTAAEVSSIGRMNAVRKVGERVADVLRQTYGVTNVTAIEGTDLLAVNAPPTAIGGLLGQPGVAGISEDYLLFTTLNDAVPLVDLPQVPRPAPAGIGTTVVILDTGSELDHPFLAGRISAQACFSAGGGCRNGGDEDFGVGAGAPCLTNCRHGTHVAGIAVGAPAAGSPQRGAAPGAEHIPIQVFAPDASQGARTGDIARGLAHVKDVLMLQHPIAAVNLSLGSRPPPACQPGDAARQELAAVIRGLRANGVAVTIASGNDGDKQNISFPACVPGAIAVGNSLDGDAGVNGSSNAGPGLAVVAPGTGIRSSILGRTYGVLTGTSMAAPLVAGGIAVLRAEADFPVDDIVTALVSTGRPILDGAVSYPRVNFAAAAQRLQANMPPAALVYIKDTPGDAGGQPDSASTGRPLWESPDLWVRTQRDGFTELHNHQNPEAGQPNYIYARVRNAGQQAARGFVAVFFVPAGGAAPSSTQWSLIGTSQSEAVHPGSSRFYEVLWSQLPAIGHYCLIVKWFPEGAPATLSFPDLEQAVRNDQTLAWKNVNVVDAQPNTATFGSQFLIDTAKVIAIEIDRSAQPGQDWYLEITLPRDAIIRFDDPTLKDAQVVDSNPIRIRVPIKRGTYYLRDLVRRAGSAETGPGKFEFRVRLAGNPEKPPVRTGRALNLRVMELRDVNSHMRDGFVNGAGVTSVLRF